MPETFSINPTLSILIPSYNRAARVSALVSHLLVFVESCNGKVELIVSDNRSTDDTWDRVNKVSSPFLTVVQQAEHWPSAESHIFHALDLCQGRYVWFHGDDDLPVISSINFALSMMETGEHDVILFNSRFIDADGGLTGSYFFRMNTDLLKMDFAKGACAVGLTTTMAGLSSVVLRREPLLEVRWKDVLSQALIYSHVAVWLIAFRDKEITFVNRPLVSYRVDDHTSIGEQTKKAAVRLVVSDYYFWTFGFAGLLQFVERHGGICPEQIRQAFDMRRDGTQFRLLDQFLDMMYAQSIVTFSSDEQRNIVSLAEIDQLSHWILRIDPSYFDCVSVIRDIFSLRNGGKGPRSPHDQQSLKLLRLRFDRLRERQYSSAADILTFIGRFMNYDVHQHLNGYVAFRNIPRDEQFLILRSLDVVPMPPRVLYALALDNLYAEIRNTHSAFNQGVVTAERSTRELGFERVAEAIVEAALISRMSLSRVLMGRCLTLCKAFRSKIRHIFGVKHECE